MLEVLAGITLVGWLFVFGLVAFVILFAEGLTLPEVPIIILAILLGGGIYHGYIDPSWFGRNWEKLVAGSVIYLIVGVGWSIFRFDRYGKDAAKLYNERLIEMTALRQKKFTQVDNPDAYGYRLPVMDEFIPVAAKNKRLIMDWIVFWWASAIWYTLSRALKDFVDAMISWLGVYYDALSRRHFPSAVVAVEATTLVAKE